MTLQPSGTTPALLDTDVLSAIMRQHPLATARARTYLATHQRFSISLITRYEVLRGLQARGATRQLAAFDQFCAVSDVLPLTDEVIVQAATIYADLYRRGLLIGDADILIAATAIHHGMSVITNNKRHFSRITGLQIENWLV